MKNELPNLSRLSLSLISFFPSIDHLFVVCVGMTGNGMFRSDRLLDTKEEVVVVAGFSGGVSTSLCSAPSRATSIPRSVVKVEVEEE